MSTKYCTLEKDVQETLVSTPACWLLPVPGMGLSEMEGEPLLSWEAPYPPPQWEIPGLRGDPYFYTQRNSVFFSSPGTSSSTSTLYKKIFEDYVTYSDLRNVIIIWLRLYQNHCRYHQFWNSGQTEIWSWILGLSLRFLGGVFLINKITSEIKRSAHAVSHTIKPIL